MMAKPSSDTRPGSAADADTHLAEGLCFD
ncbi:MAG: hypothetical protein RL749_795, partial [Verrucomicrobiota bacterium]